MKKILLIIDQINSGGAEKILLDFNTYLLDNRYETKIFVLYGDNPLYINGLKKNSKFPLAKAFQQRMLIRKAQKIVSEFDPDAIYSFLERSNILTSRLRTRAQKILTVHNLLSIQYLKLPLLLRWLSKSIIRKAYNSDVSVVAVSSQVADDLKEKFGICNNIHVINNKVDKEYIMLMSKETVREVDFVSGTKYILNIGRLSNQKAQWKLIKAVYYLVKFHSIDVKLIILGDGELKENLLHLIDNLSLKDNVFLLGHNNNPYKFIAKSDLFVLPSIFEGAPIVISEVIGLGKPFIGSKKAIPVELFSGSIADWKSCTFDIASKSPDFSTVIQEDDISLAEMIYTHLYDNKNTTVQACTVWNKTNSKYCQFSEYINLLETPYS